MKTPTQAKLDAIRLDRISDPAFVFRYSIKQDGSVTLEAPATAICKDLRQAIDFARGHVGEQPRCVACRFQLNETNQVRDRRCHGALRYFCPECRTAFDWKQGATNKSTTKNRE